MLGIILLILVILWFLGYIQIPGLSIHNAVLFTFNGRSIRVLELLICLVILWAISALPSPLKEMGAVVFFLWILSVLGIIAIAGISNILIIAIIAGLIISLIK